VPRRERTGPAKLGLVHAVDALAAIAPVAILARAAPAEPRARLVGGGGGGGGGDGHGLRDAAHLPGVHRRPTTEPRLHRFAHHALLAQAHWPPSNLTVSTFNINLFNSSFGLRNYERDGEANRVDS
jgi:hypothetical protein